MIFKTQHQNSVYHFDFFKYDLITMASILKLLVDFFSFVRYSKIFHLHFDIYIELAFRIHLFMFDPGTIYKEKTKNMQQNTVIFIGV